MTSRSLTSSTTALLHARISPVSFTTILQLFYNYHGNPDGNGNSDGREKKKYTHCKRPGHVKNDCWKLRPGKQPKRDTKNKDDKPPPAPKPAEYRSLNLMSIHDARAFLLSHRHLCDEQNAWVYDTGAIKHVCKDRELFIHFDDSYSYSSAIGIGEGETTVAGNDTVSVTLQGIDGPLKVTLTDVLYTPDCVANILSEESAKARSGVFCHGKHEAMCDNDEQPLASCHIFSLPHLLAVKNTVLTATATSPSDLALLAGTPDIWHMKLGHVPMNKLGSVANLVGGVQLSGDVDARAHDTYNCDPCLRGKAKQRASRKVQHRSTQPFEKIRLDTEGSSKQLSHLRERRKIRYI